MNLFQKLRNWLPAQMEELAGVTVTYTRKAESVTATALVGRTVFAQNADGAARVRFGERDYLIPVAALAAFGEPQRGDQVTEVIDGEELVFVVAEPGTGEPAYRYSDPQRTQWRVHVKRK